jgi:hypothetical protein
MTDEELDQINERVAKALGWKPKNTDFPSAPDIPPDYSRSIEAAWEIVERSIPKPFAYLLTIKKSYASNWYVAFNDDENIFDSVGNSLPLAICKAFLKLKENAKS